MEHQACIPDQRFDHPVDQACALLGGRVKLAEKLGVERTAIGNWKTRGIPAEHCQAIVRLTGGRVTLQQMRPKDWQKYWPELDRTSTPQPSGA